MIDIFYSSGGGNSKLVVDYIANRLQEYGKKVTVHSVVTASQEDLTSSEIIIFVAPTYDHGILHTPFEKFLNQVDEVNLEGHQAGVVGLGDDKYDSEYTCESARILKDFLVAHQAEIVSPSLEINKNPVTQLTQKIQHRVDKAFLPAIID